MSELGKPFLKNFKKTENQCKNAACEQKIHYPGMEIWFKQKSRSGMNYKWIRKTILKQSDPKNRKEQ